MLTGKFPSTGDLLNRHRRRCKSASRVCKRRACKLCAQTKSKCCFTRPTCRRCQTRGEICVYTTPGLPPSNDIEGGRTETHPVSVNAISGSPAANKMMPFQAELSNLYSARDTEAHSMFSTPSMLEGGLNDLNWDLNSSLVDESFWLRFRDVPFDQAARSSGGRGSFDSAGGPLFPFPGDGSNSPLSTSRAGRRASGTHSSRGSQRDFRGAAISSQWNNGLERPRRSQARSSSQSGDFQTTDVSHSMALDAFAITPGVVNSPTRQYEAGAADLGVPRPLRNPTTSGPNAFYTMPENSPYPPPQPTSSASVHSSYSGISGPRVYGHKHLLSIIQDYPKLMVQDEYRSPFVHHKLYYGAHTDITRMTRSSMAICCASAFGDRSSVRFVRKAIAAEQERLVHDFHLFSCVEEWDALHAMCIYQIVEFGDFEEEGYTKPGIRAADLHVPFLLKMARRFCHNHASAKEFNGADDADWLSWLVAETVRRTLFLIHIINVSVSHDEDGKASPYFEPLDDDTILALALPAPTEMWEARSPEDWRAARDRTGWLGDRRWTLGSVLDRERGAHDREAALAEVYGANPGLAGSMELRDLVIACGMMT
ncbi:MAG: hypothetical protein M1837_005144 [Sclerophora amabilis]|nr:MAG: hypothetical protein M1837_005144 [Sclerophora amabilis]